MPPLNIPKIKAEGLQVDFIKYTQEGYRALKPDDYYRLKTYGACTQKHEGFFMIRIRIPGGVIRADQIERIASLAERLGHGSAHLTTRGNLELHSVRIEDFVKLREELAEADITTRSSCGHTFRNIMCCSRNGICPKQPFDLYPWTREVHQHVFKRAEDYNPRMPNRLNVSFSGCSDCSCDAPINDIGFVAKTLEEGGRAMQGFELWVGGSLGKTPMLGRKLREFIAFEDVMPALQTITELHCRYGDQQVVVKGRLKFLIAKWGAEKFREEFEKLFDELKAGQPTLSSDLLSPAVYEPPRVWPSKDFGESILPQRQSGYYSVRFWVPLGEVLARQMYQIAELSRAYADGKAYHTTRQDFEFHWVKEAHIPNLLEAMRQVGFTPKHSESIMNVVSCPGTSFCSLAVTSSQGAAQVLMNQFMALNIDRDPDLRGITINLSGCPNSCAKHQVADIGFSGGLTQVDNIQRFGYQLYVGGRLNGRVRVGTQIKKGLPDDMVFPCAESLLEIFRTHKRNKEAFPDFVDRLGTTKLVQLLDEKLMVKKPEAMQTLIQMEPHQQTGDGKGERCARIGLAQEWDTQPAKVVSAFGDDVAVFKTPKEFKACQNLCPHAGGSLGEGESDGKTVTCPLHQWQFNLDSGACLTEPGHDIKIYKVEVNGAEVILRS